MSDLAFEFSVEKQDREYSHEYLSSVLEKVKAHLPEWLYKELHKVAMASAGGKAKARRQRELLESLELEESEESTAKGEPTSLQVHSEVPLEWEPESDLGMELGKGGLRLPVETDELRFTATIAKVDEDQHLVFGWVTIAEEDGKPLVDRQKDLISPGEMETMAYDYVLHSREGGEMHERIGVSKLVESMVFTAEKQKALGIDLGRIGWWCGFKISDDKVWAKVKSGEYSAFSIHGKGIRTKVADKEL